MLTPYKFTIIGCILLAIVAGVYTTILAFIEPNVNPSLVISLLGFLATITISLFGLLRTEQQEVSRKEKIKESLLELIEDVGRVEGVDIEAHQPDNLKSGLGILLGRVMDHAGRPRSNPN